MDLTVLIGDDALKPFTTTICVSQTQQQNIVAKNKTTAFILPSDVFIDIGKVVIFCIIPVFVDVGKNVIFLIISIVKFVVTFWVVVSVK